MDDPGTIPRPHAARYAAWFGSLADPTRIQIVSLLARRDPLRAGEIVSAVGVGQSTVSRHLRVLAEAGFVLAERRGTARYYRLNPACVTAFPTAAGLVAGAGAADPGRPREERPPHPPPVPPDPPEEGLVIRAMRPADAGRVLAIYQAGLDSGDASFETRAPAWEEFDAARLPGHRHVAVDGGNGEVLGWAAVSAVSSRCVYAGVVEHSVYVDPAARRRGAGAALLRALIRSTEAAGIWTIQSGIFPENAASLRLHEQAGFRVVGRRERIGHHHGRWRDTLLLERRSRLAGAGGEPAGGG